MKDDGILDDVLALLDGGEDFALVKLIGDRGSTPRSAGAEMLVRRDGSIAGSIGGGLLELTMMREAAAVLDSAVSRVVDLSLSGTDLASGEEMVCGGQAEVLITYVPAGDPQLARGARGGQGRPAPPAAARGCSRCCRSEEGGEVETCLLEEDGAVIGAQCDARALRTAVGKIAVHGSTHAARRSRRGRRAGRGAADGDRLRRRARGSRRRAGRARPPGSRSP